jgi:FixJ family two-component response regulator
VLLPTHTDQTSLFNVQNHEEFNLIAIVDDDQSITDALRDLLESDGLSVRCFDSGEGFLKSGLRCKVACLIADIRMPGMSGLELQAKLNADQCRPPIIFITAHGDARMRMQAMRAGAVEFLTKPFDHQLLLERVWATLERG